MSSIINSGNVRTNELIGLIEYYDAVLRKKGLIRKESEFRSNKLSLILDLIRATGISHDLSMDLMSAIIDSWRLQIPEMTLRQRIGELQTTLNSIKNIKGAIKWDSKYADSINEWQLGIIVFSDLPVMASDFQPEHTSQIYNLIDQLMEYCTSASDEKISFGEDELALAFVS